MPHTLTASADYINHRYLLDLFVSVWGSFHLKRINMSSGKIRFKGPKPFNHESMWIHVQMVRPSTWSFLNVEIEIVIPCKLGIEERTVAGVVTADMFAEPMLGWELNQVILLNHPT